MNLDELYPLHASGDQGHRFQKELAEFIITNHLETCVETGAGLSSLFIIKAMNDNGFGNLYSIDPNHWADFEVEHPRYELIKKKSVDAMVELYQKTGAWDLFLHDSNHDVLCQTYEYELAWACLKPGGWLVSDDVSWSTHNAWDKFIVRHKLYAHGCEGCGDAQTPGVSVMGSVSMVQKPRNYRALRKDEVEKYSLDCFNMAVEAEKVFLANGGFNSKVFETTV